MAGETERRHEHVGDSTERAVQDAQATLPDPPVEHVPPVYALPTGA